MSRLTIRQSYALSLLSLARRNRPTTDDGVVSDWTYYDPEIEVAYIHWSTARSLERRGRVLLANHGDETSITLVDGAA